MLLPKTEITKMLRKAAQIWNENKDYLSEISSRFGDRDHGITIGKIAGLIEEGLDGQDDDDVETLLKDLRDNTIKIGGGSAGSLYGTTIGGLSGPLEGDKPIDAGTLKEMFTEYLSAMKGVTNAGVGDRTMTDTLIPVVEAAQSAEDDVMTVPEIVKEAATKDARESEQYMSKYSRARGYKGKTIGAPDAGAVSTFLFFAGLYDGLEQTTYGGRWHTDVVNKIKWER